jgi:purine-binding chemotaxis protein CheW
VDDQLYALPSRDVREVIRVPDLARVPQGPPALLGIANLRGSVLPVAGLRELLGRNARAGPSYGRAIVLDAGAPVAIAVDSVATLENVSSEQVDLDQTELGVEGAEKLLGAFATGPDKRVVKILDVAALLEAAFSKRARTNRQQHQGDVNARSRTAVAQSKSIERLVTFEVAGQEFALPIEAVQEILQAPSRVTAVAHAEAVVLGITSVRDKLMPLLSLRRLLGFEASHAASDREKVLVVKVGQDSVGLVADRAHAIVAAELDHIDAVPPMLAARSGGESRLRSVYRTDGGRRLIGILAPERLFREDVMQRLAATRPGREQADERRDMGASQELIFLVFRLGDDEFGLPIDTVVEVAQVPEVITRVPRAPKFLEGVVNSRGQVLPVVDQRRRFNMPKLENSEGRRLVVIRTERLRAGLIVDGVSDVLRTPAENIEPPPELTEATSRLVRGVINLSAAKRMVLVLDPTELLTRAEQGRLEAFEAESKQANA